MRWGVLDERHEGRIEDGLEEADNLIDSQARVRRSKIRNLRSAKKVEYPILNQLYHAFRV